MSKAAAERAAQEVARLKAIARGLGRKILAIDPGTAATGYALLEDGEPTKLGVIVAKGATAEERLPSMCAQVADLVRTNRWLIDTLAVEWQMARPKDKRPQDIIHVGMVVGAALTIALEPQQKLETPTPSMWKGSIDGDVFVDRVKRVFPQASTLLTSVPGAVQHNAYDALGLAAWAVAHRLPWHNF